MRKAQVETVECPIGYVFHPIHGCAEFHCIYQRVYANGTGCVDVAPIDLTVTSGQGWYITLSNNITVPFTGYEFWGHSQIKFYTTLSNGQQAAVTAWTGYDYGYGFVAVDFTTSNLTCKAAYNCVGGSCTNTNKAGTSRCASYSFTSNSTTCQRPRWMDPSDKCPSLSCLSWCPTNVTASGVECSSSSCPADVPECAPTGDCWCGLYPNAASHTIIPSSNIIIIITAIVALTGAMGMGMDGGIQTE